MDMLCVIVIALLSSLSLLLFTMNLCLIRSYRRAIRQFTLRGCPVIQTPPRDRLPKGPQRQSRVVVNPSWDPVLSVPNPPSRQIARRGEMVKPPVGSPFNPIHGIVNQQYYGDAILTEA